MMDVLTLQEIIEYILVGRYISAIEMLLNIAEASNLVDIEEIRDRLFNLLKVARSRKVNSEDVISLEEILEEYGDVEELLFQYYMCKEIVKLIRDISVYNPLFLDLFDGYITGNIDVLLGYRDNFFIYPLVAIIMLMNDFVGSDPLKYEKLKEKFNDNYIDRFFRGALFFRLGIFNEDAKFYRDIARSVRIEEKKIIELKYKEKFLDKPYKEYIPAVVVEYSSFREDGSVSTLLFKPEFINWDIKPRTGEVPSILICGRKGTGKTTFLRALEYWYSLRGYNILDVSYDIYRNQILYATMPCQNEDIIRFAQRCCNWIPKAVSIIVFTNNVAFAKGIVSRYNANNVSVLLYKVDKFKRVLLKEKSKYITVIADSKSEYMSIVEDMIRVILSLKVMYDFKVVLAIDEAHLVFPRTKRKSTFNEAFLDVITHARGLKIPTIFTTQRPSMLSKDIRTTCNVYLIGNLSEADIEAILEEIPELEDKEVNIIKNPDSASYKIFCLAMHYDHPKCILKPVPPPHSLEMIQ